jgi:hypothetical protein
MCGPIPRDSAVLEPVDGGLHAVAKSAGRVAELLAGDRVVEPRHRILALREIDERLAEPLQVLGVGGIDLQLGNAVVYTSHLARDVQERGRRLGVLEAEAQILAAHLALRDGGDSGGRHVLGVHPRHRVADVLGDLAVHRTADGAVEARLAHRPGERQSGTERPTRDGDDDVGAFLSHAPHGLDVCRTLGERVGVVAPVVGHR